MSGGVCAYPPLTTSTRKDVTVTATTQTDPDLSALIARTWDQLRTPGTADTALPWERVNPVVAEHVLKVTAQVIHTLQTEAD